MTSFEAPKRPLGKKEVEGLKQLQERGPRTPWKQRAEHKRNKEAGNNKRETGSLTMRRVGEEGPKKPNKQTLKHRLKQTNPKTYKSFNNKKPL